MKKIFLLVTALLITLTACSSVDMEKVLNDFNTHGSYDDVEDKGYESELEEFYVKNKGKEYKEEDAWFSQYENVYVYRDNKGSNTFTLFHTSNKNSIGIMISNGVANMLTVVVQEKDAEGNTPCYGSYSVEKDSIEVADCGIDSNDMEKGIEKAIDLYFKELDSIVN